MVVDTSRLKRIFLQELRDVLILIAICSFATFMFAGNQMFSNFRIYSNSVLYSFIVGLSIWKGNQILGYLMNKRFPWDKEPTSTLFYHLSASVIFTIIDIIVANYLVFKYIYNINVFDDFPRYFRFAIVTLGISMLIITIIYLKHFFLSWRKSLIREAEFKRETLALQYETLKSYVNPHFLFNSLSVLSSLVEKDIVKSQRFIKQLSDIYRYVLEQKDKELVDLSTEMAFARSFIDLHKIRHGESLRVDVDVDNLSGYIMPLSTQILLENAFKHNVISEEEPLEVKVWREDDYIIVQNRLQQRNTINQTGGIGLETIKKRYEILSSKPLFVSDENLFFTVKIPILNSSILDKNK